MRRKWVAGGLAGVLGLLIVVRTQFIDVATVTSDSMSPTVCTGDMVMTSRLSGAVDAEVGDIVKFPNPGDGSPMLKRVVAVGGQRVGIADAELIVDGAVVIEPYVDLASIDGVYFGPVTVPVGSVFVMGDHRETSIDSRTFGPISTSVITGRLLWDIWSRCDNERSNSVAAATPPPSISVTSGR